MKARIESGLLPYDGRWVTLAEVEEGLRQERRRARVHAIELAFLYGANLFVSLMIIGLVAALCY